MQISSHILVKIFQQESCLSKNHTTHSIANSAESPQSTKLGAFSLFPCYSWMNFLKMSLIFNDELHTNLSIIFSATYLLKTPSKDNLMGMMVCPSAFGSTFAQSQKDLIQRCDI